MIEQVMVIVITLYLDDLYIYIYLLMSLLVRPTASMTAVLNNVVYEEHGPPPFQLQTGTV
jgi:hypothetical protein